MAGRSQLRSSQFSKHKLAIQNYLGVVRPEWNIFFRFRMSFRNSDSQRPQGWLCPRDNPLIVLPEPPLRTDTAALILDSKKNRTLTPRTHGFAVGPRHTALPWAQQPAAWCSSREAAPCSASRPPRPARPSVPAGTPWRSAGGSGSRSCHRLSPGGHCLPHRSTEGRRFRLQKMICSSIGQSDCSAGTSHPFSLLHKLCQEALLLKNIQRKVEKPEILTGFNGFQGNVDIGQRNVRCFHGAALLLEWWRLEQRTPRASAAAAGERSRRGSRGRGWQPRSRQ